MKKRKEIYLISFIFAFIITSLQIGCCTKKYCDNIQEGIDNLQKQLLEQQQDLSYLNTSMDKIVEENSSLQERVNLQGERIEQIIQNKRKNEENLDSKKGPLSNENHSTQKPNDQASQDQAKAIFNSPRKLYEKALELIFAGKVNSARLLFERYIILYPRTELADNAQYWLAECYYKEKKFGAAIEQFKKVLADYPNSNKIPDALLKIGFAYYELNQEDIALETLQKIIKNYPESPAYNLSKSKIENILSER